MNLLVGPQVPVADWRTDVAREAAEVISAAVARGCAD